jgi:enoyl-CoA hydratase
VFKSVTFTNKPFIMYENVLFDKVNGIGWITINRPNHLNALNKQTINELHSLLNSIRTDDSVGVICLTGAGEKAFVAGADIKEFAAYSVAQGGELAQTGQTLLFDFIEQFPKPIIAAINGFALGGGLELAMACHIRIASTNAKMGLPEVSLGVIPGYGGTQRLPMLIGRGRANQMICSAEMIDAQCADKWGLVNSVVEPSALKDSCDSLAQKILRNSPSAISSAIRAVNAGFKPKVDGYVTEIESFAACFGTRDFNLGVTAFLQKEKANFRQ